MSPRLRCANGRRQRSPGKRINRQFADLDLGFVDAAVVPVGGSLSLQILP